MDSHQLKILTITEYNLLANKDPKGSYDRNTRENLYEIIEKMKTNSLLLSPLEAKLSEKFVDASFSEIKDKQRSVRYAVAQYRLSSGMKNTIKRVAISLVAIICAGLLVYKFGLDTSTRKRVDLAYYEGLSKIGLGSIGDIARIKKDLSSTSTELKKVKKDKSDLAGMVEKMIGNNKVTQNFKYIVKHIYKDPGTKYETKNNVVSVTFNGKIIGQYEKNPEKWFILGIIDSGVTRVFYDDEEILEIETIFGRKGEETPVGEYQIKNRLHEPTWYTKVKVNGKTVRKAIPFGDPEHEIGRWWMGLKNFNKNTRGSYGIHGVNSTKVNDFFKKNFDWRNGSAGCLNIQSFFLDFLARTVPIGTLVTVVQKDKWEKVNPLNSPSTA